MPASLFDSGRGLTIPEIADAAHLHGAPKLLKKTTAGLFCTLLPQAGGKDEEVSGEVSVSARGAEQRDPAALIGVCFLVVCSALTKQMLK